MPRSNLVVAYHGGPAIESNELFGSQHSVQDRLADRARWDLAEFVALQDLAVRFSANKTTLIKQMLATIRKDPHLRSVFHARHLLKSDRLRTGYVRMLKFSATASSSGVSMATMHAEYDNGGDEACNLD